MELELWASGTREEISRNSLSFLKPAFPLPPCSPYLSSLIDSVKEGAGVSYLFQSCVLSNSNHMGIRGEAG